MVRTLGIVILAIAGARAGEDGSTSQPRPALVVAARVAGEPIYAGEVTNELERKLNGRKVDPNARPALEAQMLAQFVDLRLVLGYLKAHQQTVDPREVAARIEQTASLLKQRGSSLDAYLAGRGITKATLEAELTWGPSWQNYVDRHVTDKVLARYFEAHRRDYDGTEVRVSQILLARPKSADAAALEALRAQAAALREQIVAGKMTFDEAAARHSSAPSKTNGGDLGYLSRHGTMPEAISAAAFALEKDQLSPPILTLFGVHLLKVTDVRPGQKTWHDVAPALRSAVVRQGFQRIAESQRSSVAIEFTGDAPYLDPKTGRLVVPPGANR